MGHILDMKVSDFWLHNLFHLICGTGYLNFHFVHFMYKKDVGEWFAADRDYYFNDHKVHLMSINKIYSQ